MKRGEIWTVAGGPGYSGKPRPALIVQNDLFSEVQSITLCGFTTEISESPRTRPLVEPDIGNGLAGASRIMVDKITTVPRSRLGRHVGDIGTADMDRVDQALILFLGLAE